MNRRDFLKRTLAILPIPIIAPSLIKSYEKDKAISKPINNNKTYLKPIKISEGLFSNEKAVQIENYDGDRTSGFIQNKHIKDGKLEVIVCDKKNNLVLIKLPGRMLEAPGDKGYITVKKSDLEYAA